MNHADGAGGTFVVQFFQILMVLAIAYLWRYRIKKRGLREYVDVWTLAVLYFSGEAIIFALFFAFFQPFAELVYAARFIFWFLFAIAFQHIEFSHRYLKRLAVSFWLGTIVQIVISLSYWALGSGASTYDEVFATTGSSEVSGKTVVAFVVLGCATSAYWLWTEKKWDFIYGGVVFLGALVVLFSFNRASQLALFTIYAYGTAIAFQKRYYRLVIASAIVFVFCALFFISSSGFEFLARWRNVVDDGGSGRVQLIGAAARNFLNPTSSRAFWFGEGMCGMQRQMYEACGNRIGVHNDFFDLLTTYGLLGGVFYVWIVWKLWNFPRKIDRNLPEYAIIKSTTLFMLLTGLFTGMFQATYAFVMLISFHKYFYSVALRKMSRRYGDNYANERSKTIQKDEDLGML